MKGPGNRIELDVRRIWECPQCHKQRRTSGEVASLRCGCTSGGENMRLVEKQRLVRSFADVIERVTHVPDTDESEQPSAELAPEIENNADAQQPASTPPPDPTENPSTESPP
jgi:hypothetical protein